MARNRPEPSAVTKFGIFSFPFVMTISKFPVPAWLASTEKNQSNSDDSRMIAHHASSP